MGSGVGFNGETLNFWLRNDRFGSCTPEVWSDHIKKQSTGIPVSRCKLELDSVTHGTINTSANRQRAVMRNIAQLVEQRYF